MPRPGKTLDFATLLAASVHDMKNGLSQLLLLSDELAADDPQDLRVGQLQNQARQLNRNLVQLLALYKLDAELYPACFDGCYMDELLDDCIAANTAAAEASGLRLQLAPDTAPAVIEWSLDGELVLATLNTLVHNALNHARQRVWISAQLVAGGLAVHVDDDGPGFDDEVKGRFSEQPGMQQVDFLSGSTGFGLYFAEQVAAFHQHQGCAGYISLATAPQLSGGRVRLWLPAITE